MGVAIAWGLAGCGQQTAEAPAAPTAPPGYSRTVPGPAVRGNQPVARQEAFLARIKRAAAGNGVIREVRMRGDNELGVVFGQQVKLREIKPLMTTLLREMRGEFPGRVLLVRAYAPNGKSLATMRFDPSAPPNANTTFTTAPGLS